VVDAAGAIYVIGGFGTDFYQDVWASTDGGSRAGRRLGGVLRGWGGAAWALQGYSGGTTGVLKGLLTTRVLQGYLRGNARVLHGYKGTTEGTTRKLQGNYREYLGVLWGYFRGTSGVIRGYTGGTTGYLWGA
jgi:hypothetical protein